METLFSTKHLIVRTVKDSDAEKLLQSRNSSFVNKYNIYPKVNLNDFLDELKQINTLIIETCDTPIGCIYIKDDPFRYHTNSYELAGWLTEEYARKGFMSEIMPPLMDFLFSQKNVERLATHMFSKNEAPHRLMEKFGFIKEGRLCQALKNIDGEYIDIDIFSVSKTEYLKNKEQQKTIR